MASNPNITIKVNAKNSGDYIVIKDMSTGIAQGEEIEITVTSAGYTKTLFLKVGEELKYLPPRDGVYNISAKDGNNANVLYYLYSLKLFLRRFKAIICDCSCDDCFPKKESKFDDLNYLIMLSDKLKVLLNDCAIFNSVYNKYKSKIWTGSICKPEEVIINGKEYASLEDITKAESIKLAFDFLIFYKATLSSNTDEDYVNKLFDINNIKCCFDKLNIDINELNTLIQMGNFNITFKAYVNQPPTVVGNSITAPNRTGRIITYDDLITNAGYNDPEGDPPVSIKITALPAPRTGELQFAGQPVTLNQEIDIADIQAGALTALGPNTNDSTTLHFEYVVKDAGSGQYGT